MYTRFSSSCHATGLSYGRYNSTPLLARLRNRNKTNKEFIPHTKQPKGRKRGMTSKDIEKKKTSPKYFCVYFQPFYITRPCCDPSHTTICHTLSPCLAFIAFLKIRLQSHWKSSWWSFLHLYNCVIREVTDWIKMVFHVKSHCHECNLFKDGLCHCSDLVAWSDILHLILDQLPVLHMTIFHFLLWSVSFKLPVCLWWRLAPQPNQEIEISFIFEIFISFFFSLLRCEIFSYYTEYILTGGSNCTYYNFVPRAGSRKFVPPAKYL